MPNSAPSQTIMFFKEFAKNDLNMSDENLNKFIDNLKELFNKFNTNDDLYWADGDLAVDFLAIMENFKITQAQLEPTIEALFDYRNDDDIRRLIAHVVFSLDHNLRFMEFENYKINQYSRVYDKILKSWGFREDDEDSEEDENSSDY